MYCSVTIILPKHHSVVENMLWILSYWECWVCSESLTFGFWAKLQSCSCKQAFLACQKAQWEIGSFSFTEGSPWFASEKHVCRTSSMICFQETGLISLREMELWRSYGKLLLFLMVTVSARLKPAPGCHLWLDLLTFYLLLSKEIEKSWAIFFLSIQKAFAGWEWGNQINCPVQHPSLAILGRLEIYYLLPLHLPCQISVSKADEAVGMLYRNLCIYLNSSNLHSSICDFSSSSTGSSFWNARGPKPQQAPPEAPYGTQDTSSPRTRPSVFNHEAKIAAFTWPRLGKGLLCFIATFSWPRLDKVDLLCFPPAAL